MAAVIKRIFRRKNKAPLACSILMLDDADHVHTNACFLDVQPLAVVELFQSQGCKSCVVNVPKIHEAVQNPNVILLTYNVTHFDRAEWQDTFASKQWDSRQRAYVTKWGRNSIFTPQVIVDGTTDGTGETVDQVMDLVQRARQMRSQQNWNILLDSNDTELRIDTDLFETKPHDIILCYYEPKPQVVKIGKGVNKGKKLTHQNVVRMVSKIGEWRGGNLTITLPSLVEARDRGYSILGIVQEPSGGRILAAHSL
ncbi:hypothetical protein TMatcc_004944 [Talaromyces marneffei ATCC 18224]|uniref:Uncharacterized protein n=2 Tax=Talaromyces marneffei TaxID=37727 RepID=B6Q803_TALMQ|nr:uncharacterized protein EYB26_000138 [Talaromyces marneffei]EEA26766.1 conserved hypothetical protein [Talaromyces marneffei ATCC 18224]KAE8557490.1 hypothetical protein EYB25_002197 [Talaromyces marneffei]QGA12494.1 hypothetical protein EYB26_000138 [Talaromyces marneffei]